MMYFSRRVSENMTNCNEGEKRGVLKMAKFIVMYLDSYSYTNNNEDNKSKYRSVKFRIHNDH